MHFLSGILNKLRNQPTKTPGSYATVQSTEQRRATILPPSQKKQQMAVLQAGYNEMLDLSRSIRDHLESQQELQVKIGETLDQVPEAVGHLRQICRNADRQSEAISNLVESTCQTQELLHEVMRRSERRLILTLLLFLLTIVAVIGGGIYLILPQYQKTAPATTIDEPAKTAIVIPEEMLSTNTLEKAEQPTEKRGFLPFSLFRD